MEFFAHINSSSDKQLLKDHLMQVAQRCSGFSGKINLPKTGEILGLLHDLGKYSDNFQNYLASATGLLDQDADDFIDAANSKGKIDHSTAGAQYIRDAVICETQLVQIAGQLMSLCLASHHSGLIDCLSTEGENVFVRRMNKSHNLTFLPQVKTRADNLITGKFNELLIGGADEIIKNLKLFTAGNNNEIIIRFYSGLMTKMLFSCLIDADRLDTADYEFPDKAKMRQLGNYAGWDKLSERLERHLEKLEIGTRSPINIIRKTVSDACFTKASEQQGIFTLTVPTGGGKTLSSLGFAIQHAKVHKLDRIIYVIPYTSIIDQNARVVRDIFEIEKADKGKIVLEHHSNLLPERFSWKTKLLSEDWDAPVVFTTNVQLLEVLFGTGTRSIRRLHQLANSVLIFDEIQTMPVKTIHLFCNAINYLIGYCHTSVVLCTATQPLLNKVSKEKGCIQYDSSNEIIPDVDNLYSNLKRVEIVNRCKNEGWKIEEIAHLANVQTVDSGSCLVVVNTKKSAKSIFKECLKYKDIHVYHLSTSMCPAHRAEKLAEIQDRLNNNAPVLCISTQLIEAGVDIDFGSVIRSVAGLDSIAQAAGRCNRNGKRKTGFVFIVNPAEENIDSLNDIKEGQTTALRILREIADPKSDLPQDILSPKVMERYFQYYFFKRSDEMSFPVDVGRDDNILNLLSINKYSVDEHCRINRKAPDIFLRQSFSSAAEKFKSIDSLTQGIIVPYGDGRAIIADLFSQFASEKQNLLLKKAQRYTVNVFPNELKKLKEERALHEVPEIGVLVLDDQYYHQEFGLSTEPVNEMNFLNK